jgi:hypothetical protein
MVLKLSAWKKGVETYKHDLLDFLVENNMKISKENMLNGAKNWKEYSYGGGSYIYDYQIAELLCTPSELKRKKGGELQPNKSEQWLDVQARALNQACRAILREHHIND